MGRKPLERENEEMVQFSCKVTKNDRARLDFIASATGIGYANIFKMGLDMIMPIAMHQQTLINKVRGAARDLAEASSEAFCETYPVKKAAETMEKAITPNPIPIIEEPKSIVQPEPKKSIDKSDLDMEDILNNLS